jgi:hypothetical protein
MINNPSKSGRRQFWEGHIAQCAASGLSQVEYCRLEKISIKSFYYWKRKSKGRAEVPALVEVPLPGSIPIPSLYPPLCLVIGRECRIEIGRGFNPEDLEQVIRVLGRI